MARLIDGRHTRVQPERRPERGDRGDERVLRRPATDGVEIGRVQLGQTEPARVGARERPRVARLDGRSGDRLNARIALAPAASGVHGVPGNQIHDADHSQSGSPTAVFPVR